MSLISRNFAHWQPSSSVSCVGNWQRLLRMQQINFLPGPGQPDWSTEGNQHAHSSRRRVTVNPADLYRPRANVSTKATMSLNPSEGTEEALLPQEQQPQSLPPLRSQPLPELPLSHMATTAANGQDFDDDGEDDSYMHLGGDEEEKALFEECTGPTVIVAMPEASRHMALPPLRPSPSTTAGSTEEAVAEQVTFGNDGSTTLSPRLHGWLDQTADASVPISPPPTYCPVFFSPAYCGYNHVLSRLPADSIPMNMPHTDPKKLRWGPSPLARLALSEELAGAH